MYLFFISKEGKDFWLEFKVMKKIETISHQSTDSVNQPISDSLTPVATYENQPVNNSFTPVTMLLKVSKLIKVPNF